jgi:hypothetical protein
MTAAALPPVTVPNLSPRWVTLLRDTKLIAHGEITGGAYASEGLHERNAWLYDALVCILYSESASQSSFSGLPTDEDRFDELAQRVRAYITEANSTYSPKIANFTAELTWRHLQTEKLLNLETGGGQGVYGGHSQGWGREAQTDPNTDPIVQLLQAFAVYITGHALRHGGAGSCAGDPARSSSLRKALDEVRRQGFTFVDGTPRQLALVGRNDFVSVLS